MSHHDEEVIPTVGGGQKMVVGSIRQLTTPSSDKPGVTLADKSTSVFLSGLSVPSKGDMELFPTEEDIRKELALRTGGARFDAGKSRVDLIPAEVLLLLGEIYEMGARKYDASNWRKGMRWSKVYGPLFRHLLKFWMGQKLDEESKKLHIMHVVWNAVALALYVIKPEYHQFDDRQDPVNLVDMPEEDRQRLYV